ncbi:hypothetical protein BOVA115_4360 [Bacteroides ovatus]|nr:hypothetical protein BOVA115_4360 [Bacteroides ovatus]
MDLNGRNTELTFVNVLFNFGKSIYRMNTYSKFMVYHITK